MSRQVCKWSAENKYTHNNYQTLGEWSAVVSTSMYQASGREFKPCMMHYFLQHPTMSTDEQRSLVLVCGQSCVPWEIVKCNIYMYSYSSFSKVFEWPFSSMLGCKMYCPCSVFFPNTLSVMADRHDSYYSKDYNENAFMCLLALIQNIKHMKYQ